MKNILLFIIAVITMVGVSCTTEDNNYGHISVNFTHEVGGNTLETDTLKYVNAAGNYYSVSELKYFISDIQFTRSDGSVYIPDEDLNIHYVDISEPETMLWAFPDSIPTGVYKSMSFTFGIEEDQNEAGLFLTPPEVLMESSEELGGGYNYLRMTGRYANTPGVNEQEYEFYLGIGQIHPSQGLGADEVTYVHNQFPVTINTLSFELDDHEEVVINLLMEINNWFRQPHEWNFYNTGGTIITNQDAQLMAKENGNNVFSAYLEETRDFPQGQ